MDQRSVTFRSANFNSFRKLQRDSSSAGCPAFEGSRCLMRRIPDWTSLDAAARHGWRSSARERASALNTKLNAFVEIAPAKTRHGRTLDGMPYAAKDMLRTPGHQPSGGLSGAADLGIVGNSDLLDRLDEAGADRIGFTQMTELAYEPSGFNASRGRMKNPWSLDRVPGGSSSGSGMSALRSLMGAKRTRYARVEFFSV